VGDALQTPAAGGKLRHRSRPKHSSGGRASRAGAAPAIKSPFLPRSPPPPVPLTSGPILGESVSRNFIRRLEVLKTGEKVNGPPILNLDLSAAWPLDWVVGQRFLLGSLPFYILVGRLLGQVEAGPCTTMPPRCGWAHGPPPEDRLRMVTSRPPSTGPSASLAPFCKCPAVVAMGLRDAKTPVFFFLDYSAELGPGFFSPRSFAWNFVDCFYGGNAGVFFLTRNVWLPGPCARESGGPWFEVFWWKINAWLNTAEQIPFREIPGCPFCVPGLGLVRPPPSVVGPSAFFVSPI